ncbi:hypothetical protein VAE122_2630004 [Vibrio aestuarianus]|nr:hypothetical protein VAE122_2630004 [Vibrio aestuarianus]
MDEFTASAKVFASSSVFKPEKVWISYGHMMTLNLVCNVYL